MSKYRRKKKSNSFLGILAVIAVVVFLVVENPQLLIAILAATVIVCLVVGVLFFLRKRNTAPVEMTQEESFPMQERQYFAKASLLTRPYIKNCCISLALHILCRRRYPLARLWKNNRNQNTEMNYSAFWITVFLIKNGALL